MMTVLIVLVALWLFGLLRVPGLPVLRDFPLFTILGHTFTLYEVLMFVAIAWAMESLPSPLRQIAYVLVLLWILSIFGFLAVSGLSNLIVLALIIGLVVSLFQKR